MKAELDAVVAELSDRDRDEEPTPEVLPQCNCPARIVLEGRSVAMVGGIGSLEHHYRELIEEMGGRFCRHSGDCRRGERLLEDCISAADLVVCPIKVNSHNAANP